MYERNYQKRVLKQDPIVSEKKQFPWKRVTIIFGIVVLCAGCVFLTRAPFQKVQSVSVGGAEVTDPEEVSMYVKKILEGNRVYVLPRSSTLLLSVNSIENRLKYAFPRLKSVVVHRDSLHSLSVAVEEYKGIYLWCKEECFFMDENGVVFASAPYFSGSAYVRISAGEQAGLPFTPITKEQLSLVTLLTERLRAIMLEPNEFRFISPYELDIVFTHNGDTAKLMIDPTQDTETTLEALYAGMRAPSFEQLYRDENKKIEYINLRFNNKMVYKFQ
jgi:cell division septal protein FtsQ